MVLLLSFGIPRDLLGIFLVITLLSAFLSTIVVYAAATRAEHEDPSKLARIVAVSHVGTVVVGYPVFLVAMIRLIIKVDKMEKERERKRVE